MTHCQGTQIFVYNVENGIEEAQLKGIFNEEGTVIGADNTERGYAFVSYTSHHEAKKARRRWSGKRLLGWRITCKMVTAPRRKKGWEEASNEDTPHNQQDKGGGRHKADNNNWR